MRPTGPTACASLGLVEPVRPGDSRCFQPFCPPRLLGSITLVTRTVADAEGGGGVDGTHVEHSTRHASWEKHHMQGMLRHGARYLLVLNLNFVR